MSIPATIQSICDRCQRKVTFRATDLSGNGYRCTCSCHGRTS